jgi:ketosteroid isomerase-like protein
VDELELVESRLLAALQRADLVGVAELLRDDFLITTAGWLSEPVDKTTWLAGLSDRMTLDRFTLRLVASRRFGEAAVVLVESDQSGTHDGISFSMTFRYTDTWVFEDDRWRLAVRHASTAPPPP